jgi:hypothetical protein
VSEIAGPTFLLAGAARSGTTSLIEGLRQHPLVFVTRPKEPHYFALHGCDPDFRGPGDAASINRVAVTARSEYLALYPRGGEFLALGEGSVSTLYYAERAAPEIARMNPDMRVVLILREPVDRAFSSYQYLRARGFEPLDDFLAAVEDEPRRRDENWHHLWHYTAMSRYAAGVLTLRQTLGADRVGVWFYDDLLSDYAGTVRDVLRFLNLPTGPSDVVDVPRVNVSGTPKNAILHRGILWVTRHDMLRRSVKRMTSFGARERIRRSSLRPSQAPGEARRELSSYFEEDLRSLSEVLSGPVPEWLRSRKSNQVPD